MNNRFIRKYAAAGAALLASAVTSPVFAAAIDVSAVVDDIEAQAGPVGLIGGAVLLLTVAIAAFMWVRKAVK